MIDCAILEGVHFKISLNYMDNPHQRSLAKSFSSLNLV